MTYQNLQMSRKNNNCKKRKTQGKETEGKKSNIGKKLGQKNTEAHTHTKVPAGDHQSRRSRRLQRGGF